MCGIVGVVAKSYVNQEIYDALTVLQHRGQDAAGIMTCDDAHVYLRKSNGLVRDVLSSRHMLRLKGNMGIGHVRYPTAGCASEAEKHRPDRIQTRCALIATLRFDENEVHSSP